MKDFQKTYKINKKKIWLVAVPICMVLIVYNTMQVTAQYEAIAFLNPGNDFFDNLSLAFYSALHNVFRPSFSLNGLYLGLVLVLILFGVYTYKESEKKNYRPGEEHGSAKKGDVFQDGVRLAAQFNSDQKKQDFKNNIILSENIQLDLDTWHTRLNNNIFVVGGSGSGKTRYFVKPNVLQMHGNYCIVDPKGSLIEEIGNALDKNAYSIPCLNLVNMDKSMGYNPFIYFRGPNDIQKFVMNLIENTSDKSKSGGDEFFVKSEITWITAVIYYIMATCSGTDKCAIPTIMTMLENSKVSEEDENFKSTVDQMFDDLEEQLQFSGQGNDYSYADLAIRNYKIFKQGAGKTAKSILISIGVRLSIFNLPALRKILSKDELHLDRIGNPMVIDEKHPDDLSYDVEREVFERMNPGKDYEKLPKERLRKTAFFIVTSDSDSTFSFLTSIVLQQMYSELFYAADNRKDHKLPIHTRFINDEFANCGKQPDFQRKIATMRSREISTAVIVQGISQIKSKSLYGEDWEAIFENCDTTLFLGSKGPTTLEEIKKMAGKETVAIKTNSVTKGQSSSYSTSEQYVTRDLYDYAELAKMPLDTCLVHIKGYDIFEDKKYDVTKHPNVDLTMDAKENGNDNFFEVADYIERARGIFDKQDAVKNKKTRVDLESKEIEALRRGELIGNINLDAQHEDIYLDSSILDFVDTEIVQSDSYQIDMLPN